MKGLVSRSILPLQLLGLLLLPVMLLGVSAPPLGTNSLPQSGSPDYSMAPTPQSLAIPQGSAGQSSMNVTSINGFQGTVNLVSSTSCTSCSVSLNPTSVNLASNVTGQATLTISTTPSTPMATFTATVRGTSGSLSHSVTVTFTVTSPVKMDFTLSANPTSLTIVSGSSASSTITATGLGGFSGTVSLSSSASPPGVAATLSPQSITLSSGGSGTATLTVTSSTLGSYSVMVTGASGSLSHNVMVPVKVTSKPQPDFTMSAHPPSVIVPSGYSNTSRIILTSVGGFNGTIQVDSPSPLCPSPGCTVWSVNPTSVDLPPNGNASTTLTILGGTAGTKGYATVYGKSGSLSHAVNVTFEVVSSATTDFAMSANPQSLTITQGASGTSTITVQSIGGFQGTANLTPPATCASLNCYTVSISPMSVSLTPDGSANAILTISTTPSTTIGTYTVSIQGTSGSLSHSVSVTFTVVSQPGASDFTITANPSSLTIPAGGTATSTITFTSANGFSGTVTVSTSPPPACPSPQCTQWSISPSSVSLSGNGTARATLTVVAGTQGGPGSVTIYGTSGSHSHSVTVSITIIVPASPDFSITANPGNVTVDQGQSVTSLLVLTSYAGFQGNLSLVTSINCTSGTCPVVSLSQATLHLTANGTATTTLTVSTSTLTTLGTYIITVTGTSGSLSHSVTMTVTVVDPPSFGGGGGGHFFM